MNLSLLSRLQHEVSLLQQQLCESRELLHSLQSELQVYDRVCANAKGNPGQLTHFIHKLVVSYSTAIQEVAFISMLINGIIC